MHTSVRLECPVEFINVTPLNPLISKCEIKVCYVGDEPNRNRSIITKDVARRMANSLPGSPIVGYFNEEKQDFEEHNRVIDISNGKFEIKDTTRPYGFVDLGAKVWFQKFLDDGVNEREYLMTEGWLWTGQYPECQRMVDKGNNQSMELDKKTLNATWTKDNNGKPQFFIINEAIISKLCTLGENYEPCFEGAGITAPTIQFAFEDGFKEELFSMMNELKELLNKGGEEKVFTRYAVEIGDALWTALYSHVEGNYEIESVCEEGEQLFAVLVADGKYYRLNFSFVDDVFTPAENAELMEEYTPAEEAQFSAEAVAEYAKAKKDAKAKDNDDDDDDDDKEEKCPKCGKKKSECTCEDDDDDDEDDKNKKKKDKKSKYSLEEIQEYVELSENYSALEASHNEALETIKTLNAQIEELTAFKHKIEKAEKEKMIESFYMLSDEDKKDVVANIDTYSLDDIEAKLSIICVRNKVNFNLEDDRGTDTDPTVFNLNGNIDDEVPAWIKSLRSVAKDM